MNRVIGLSPGTQEMNIFWLLLLTHLMADFPLQTNRIYDVKNKNAVGIIPHVAIYTVLNVVVLLPFLNSVYTWIAIVTLTIIHTVIDRGKIIFVRSGQRDDLLHFAIDQVIHILSVWVISQWLARNYNLPIVINCQFFEDPRYAILISGLILCTFAGTAFIHYVVLDLKRWRNHNRFLKLHYPKYHERIVGFVERLIATLSFVVGGTFMIITVIAFVPKCLLRWRRDNHILVIAEAGAGILVSICSGLLIRAWW
jgi:hypothetical protein